MIYSKKNCDTKQRFSIRKLTVGTCSVLLSTLFLTMNSNQVVHADENASASPETEEDTTAANQTLQKKEVSLNSSDSTQTQKSKVTDDKKTSTDATGNTKSKTNTNLVKENVPQHDTENKQHIDNTKTTNLKSDSQKLSQETGNTTSQKDIKTAVPSNNTQHKEAIEKAPNKANDISTNDLNVKPTLAANSKDLTKSLKESKTATELPTPELNSAFNQNAYAGYVVQGSDMGEIASKFLTNSDAIKAAGGKISWDGPTTITDDDITSGGQLSGNIVVTYPDQKKKSVTAYFMGVARTAANANLQANQNQTGFLYVPKVGDKISLDALDINNTAIFNNNATNSIIPSHDSMGVALSAKIVGSPDTSTIGFHDLTVEVTDNGNADGMTVIGSPYELKVPYLVQTLEPISEKPVINVQKITTASAAGSSHVEFQWPWFSENYDSLSSSGSGIGRYFYKDFLKYFALGGNLYVSSVHNDFGTVDNPVQEITVRLVTTSSTPQVLTDSPALTVKLNWINSPTHNPIYIFKDPNQNNPVVIKQDIIKQLNNMNDKELADAFSKIVLANGQTTSLTAFKFSKNGIPMAIIAGLPSLGKYTTDLNLTYGEGSDTANGFIPDIFSKSSVMPKSDVLTLLQKYNPTLSRAEFGWGSGGSNVTYSPTQWVNMPVDIYSINIPKNIEKTVDISNGPQSYTANELKDAYLKQLTYGTNPTSADWPKGTTFEFANGDAKDGKITMDAPGQTKTTQIKITLPGGSTATIDAVLNTAALSKNQREVKVRYLDSDENDKLVSIADGFKIGEIGSDVTFNLSIPENYELKPNQSGISNTTLTYKIVNEQDENGIQYANVYLIHKTEKITDPTQAEIQQTRTATVNYVYGTDVRDNQGNIIHTRNSKAAESAILDVFYTRSAIKDLVTGNITYGNWQWDSTKSNDGYSNGYKVVSGKWTSLPTTWNPVVADVPTLDGFTAWTKTSQSTVPTNEFAFPTYVNKGTSDINGNSTAYTPTADTYEARPVHTVWYLPIETQTRTITENYKIVNDQGQATGDLIPSEQIEVFYNKKAINYDENTGQVTYGDWKWNQDAGDKDTPGFHIISGTHWKMPETPSSSWGVNLPIRAGYTHVYLGQDGKFDTSMLGNPNLNSNTIFTSDTGIVYMRNNITTYYVSNNILQKTITRKITVNYPESTPTTSTQAVTLNRRPYVNSDDTGVIFGGWSTGIWSNYDSNIPVVTGYTPYIIIDGSESSTIPEVVVTSTTKNSNVSINYVKNSADVTINHQEINQVYNGQGAIIPDDITDLITPADSHIIIPDAVKNVKFDTSDYSFANDEGESIAVPTNVGSYHIILNQNGLNKLKNAAPDFTFKYDPKTSYVIYNIIPAPASITLTGLEEVTYNNQDITNVSSDNIKVIIQANPELTYSLQSGDYQFIQNGQVVTPKNAGTYEIQLTNEGISHITSLGNGNYNWLINGKPNISQNAKLIINKALPTVSINGSASKTYDGTPISQYSPKVTISAPGVNDITLTKGDFEFNVSGTWTSTAPVDVGSYRVRLTKLGLDKIISQNVNNISWADNYNVNGEYKIIPASINIDLHGDGFKIYNGTEVMPSVTVGKDGNAILTGVPTQGANIVIDNLTANAFEWSNSQGQVLKSNPVNAGTYTLTLTDAALTELATQNHNYIFTKSGKYTFIIEKAQAIINTTGEQTMSWTGNQVAIDPTKFNQKISTNNNLSITVPSSVKLTAQDYDLVNAQGNIITIPTAVGHYYVKLNENGLGKIKNAISANSNYNWVSSGEGNYNIEKAQAMITLNGESSVIYNGSQATIPTNDDGTVKGITVTLSNGKIYNLKPSDLKFMNFNHINAGSYKLQLSDEGLANIRAIDAEQYEYNYDNSQATLIVEKATANYQLSGSESKTYKGSQYNDNDLTPGHYRIKITTNNGQTLTYTLKQGDIAFAPNQKVLNKGIYKVVLTEQGINNIKALDPNNYNWNELAPQANFDVTAKDMSVNITGTTHSIYEHEANNWDNGIAQGVPTDQMDQISMIWAGENTKPDGVTALQLSDSDLVYYQKNSSGKWVEIIDNGGLPVHAGTYGIKLTAEAIKRLNNQNKDSNYTFTNGNNIIATFTIDARKAKVTLSGSQSAPYTTNKPLDYHNFIVQLTDTDSGTPVSINWDSISGNKNDYLVIAGYENGGLPKNVGSYDVKVTKNLIEKLKSLFPDYNFEGTTINLRTTNKFDNTQDQDDIVVPENNNGKYIITPLDADIELTGSQVIRYGEDSTIIPDKFTISFLDSLNHQVLNPNTNQPLTFTLTSADLQINTSTTNNPLHVGEYKVLLKKSVIDKIVSLTQVGNVNNYEWSKIIANDATFVVEAMPVSVKIANANNDSPANVIFGNPISLNDNLNKYIISLITNNGKTLEYTLQKGDLEFTAGVPTTAGVFDVKLSAQGLENLKRKFNKDYPNYDFNKLTSTATFVVQASTPHITITANSQKQKIYDGQPAEIKAGDYTITITSNASDITIGDLNGSSLQFENGSSPTDVGSYNVVLTKEAIEKLKAEYPNFNWSKANKVIGTYKIVASEAKATLSGQNSMIYNGQTVTSADLNNGGNICVDITLNGVNKTIKYKLQPSDYIWNTEDKTAPENVGSYTLQLNKKQILTHLQEAINASEGLGQDKQPNVIISLDNLSGSAKFTIDKKIVEVVLDGSQLATYNGNKISIDPSKFTVTLDNGERYKLQDGDLQYVDSATNADIDAGTWQVTLTKQGEEAISKLNQNYDYKFSGTGKVIISKVDVTNNEISFSHTGNAAKIYDGTPIANYQPTVTITAPGASEVTLDSNDYKFIRQDGTIFDSAPSAAGVYKVVLTEAGIDKIKAVNKKNLNWSKINFNDSVGTYTIYKASAKAVLSGNGTIIYNGQAVTSQELNSHGIKVAISIKVGNDTKIINYWLHNGDYIWKTDDNVAQAT